jgi:hypothetical protein
LTPEEQTYYENYFSLFLMDGWRQLVDEVTETLDSYRIEDITDQDHLNVIKGEIKMLKRIQNFESGIRNAYDMNTENSDDPSL